MGWWGVVFKGDISGISDYLAIGLTTGYLGSLTTFSGWNQKMLDLSVDGRWLFAIFGFLIGKTMNQDTKTPKRTLYGLRITTLHNNMILFT